MYVVSSDVLCGVPLKKLLAEKRDRGRWDAPTKYVGEEVALS